MNITNTLVTRSAVLETAGAFYYAEYTEENERLLRVQCNIHEPAVEDDVPGPYVGSVHMDHGTISCNMPFSEKSADYFKTAADMIVSILEQYPQPDDDQADTNKPTR